MKIAIIPARGGSTRIPRKNIRDFHGKPIICYAIETAVKSALFDRIHVSSDDQEILSIAEKAGATPYLRPHPWQENGIGTQEVTRQAMEAMYPGANHTVCCIYPCTPLLAIGHLNEGYSSMQCANHSYSLAVGTDPLRDIGWFYWGRQSDLRADVELININTRLCPVDEEIAIDINTMEDWRRAEYAYARIHNLQVKPA